MIFKKLFGKSHKKQKSLGLDEIESLVTSMSFKEIKSFLLNICYPRNDLFTIVKRGESYPDGFESYTGSHISEPKDEHKKLFLEASADFFETFNHFSINYGDFKADYSFCGVSSFSDEYIRIAYDMGQEVVVKKGSEVAFLLDYDDQSETISEPYLDFTIWHYILKQVFIIYPELIEKIEA